MLEQYFLRPTTVDRIRSNGLAPQIEDYVEWMHAQKYAGPFCKCGKWHGGENLAIRRQTNPSALSNSDLRPVRL
jgi:hypothetical protein